MNKISFKDLILNIDQKTCFVKNKEVYLTKHEYLLLQFLLENQNKIFTRKEIIETVWQKKISFRTVDVTISRLRKKLKQYGEYIKTRSGFGYGFIIE